MSYHNAAILALVPRHSPRSLPFIPLLVLILPSPRSFRPRRTPRSAAVPRHWEQKDKQHCRRCTRSAALPSGSIPARSATGWATLVLSRLSSWMRPRPLLHLSAIVTQSQSPHQQRHCASTIPRHTTLAHAVRHVRIAPMTAKQGHRTCRRFAHRNPSTASPLGCLRLMAMCSSRQCIRPTTTPTARCTMARPCIAHPTSTRARGAGFSSRSNNARSWFPMRSISSFRAEEEWLKMPWKS